MGCSSSKQATPLDAAPHGPEMRPTSAATRAVSQPPAAAAHAAAPTSGAQGEEADGFGEVIYQWSRAVIPYPGADLVFTGFRYLLPSKRGVTPEEIRLEELEDLEENGPVPGPPDMKPSMADRERGIAFGKNDHQFFGMAREMGIALLAWGPPGAAGVFFRLIAGAEGKVSADAAFVVGWDIVLPHEVHSSVKKQQEMYETMWKPWLDFVQRRVAGTDLPGDIVLFYRSDGSLTLGGIGWTPHTYFGIQRRKLWLPALKSFCDAQRPAPTAEQKTQAFCQTFNPIISAMLKDIVTWPPIDGQVGWLEITLVHLPGRGPSARVVLRDLSNKDITNVATETFPDPTLLQDLIAKPWIDLCATGTPDVDHPPLVILSGPGPSVGGAGLNLASRWGAENLFPPEHREAVAETYRLRPDEVPRARFFQGGLFQDAEHGDEDAFHAAFNPALSGLLSPLFAWRPADGVTKVALLLAQTPARGPVARPAIFDRSGTCFVGMAADGRPPRALHDMVTDRWTQFCAAHPKILPLMLAVVCMPGGAHQGGQMDASFEMRGVWEEKDLSPADRMIVSLLYGELPNNPGYSAARGGTVSIATRVGGMQLAPE